MDTKAMEYILEIAHYKSVTKAAKALCISQSALSQILLRIERELGSPLFIRKKRSLIPTDTGYLYFDAAQKILDTKRKLYADIDDLAGSKRIRFGLTSHWGMLMMLDILPTFHERFPNTVIELRQYNYQSLREEYLQYGIDLAVTTISPNDAVPENAEILREEEMRLILSCSHPFSIAHAHEAEVPEITIKRDLAGLSIIRSAIGSASRIMEDELFARIGFTPRAFCEVTDYITFINLVEANLGFAFISADYVNTSDKICNWRLSPRLVRNNALLIRPGLKLGEPEQYLIEHIRGYRIFNLGKPL
ncbi:MAG: LysR family transcriptional regulator [Oscillospiraceae bacterium]